MSAARGRLALLGAAAFIGSTVIASAQARDLDPFLAALIRFAVATPILIACCCVMKARLPRLSLRAWGILALQSGAGSLGYTAALVAGMKYSSPADAAVLTGLLPVMTALASVAALGERPGLRLMLAAGLASVGAGLIAFRDAQAEAGAHPLLGLGLILLALLGESLFAILNKRIRTPIPPIVVATLMSALALAMGLMPGAIALAREGWPAPGPFAAMVYYGIGPTVIGFSLWFWGARRVSGVEASTYMAFAPVCALLLSFFWLDAPLTWRHAAGLACVLAAIGLASAGRRAL